MSGRFFMRAAGASASGRHRLMDDFFLITHWWMPAPIDTVWDALHNVHRWPRWWKYVKAVTDIAPDDANGVGARRHFVWSTRLPYEISFDMSTTHMQRPFLIEGRAS